MTLATRIFYALSVIYLDHNATSSVRPEVLEAIALYDSIYFGNPSSSHRAGRLARQAVEDARDELRQLIGAEDSQLWFTSGATESISWFFDSICSGSSERKEILLAEIEHKAVLESARHYAERFDLVTRYIGTLPTGVINLEQLHGSMTDRTRLVSVMTANNETGALQPIRHLTQMARDRGVFSFTDATQAVGKMALKVSDLGPDALCFNAHKIGGPKGVGALVAVTSDARKMLRPWTHGGGQEGGLRGGTLNVAAIVGLAVTVRLAVNGLERFIRNCELLRTMFLQVLAQSDVKFELNCENVPALCNTLSIRLVGVDADALVARIHDVAISTGSACQSAVQSPSHVLIAMRQDISRARETIRVSFGWNTTQPDAVSAAKRIAEESKLLLSLDTKQSISGDYP